MKTVEQAARDLLERMEIPGAQDMTAGELIELANLISEVRNLRRELGQMRRGVHA